MANPPDPATDLDYKLVVSVLLLSPRLPALPTCLCVGPSFMSSALPP
nr:E4 protein [Lemur mastadenovirus]